MWTKDTFVMFAGSDSELRFDCYSKADDGSSDEGRTYAFTRGQLEKLAPALVNYNEAVVLHPKLAICAYAHYDSQVTYLIEAQYAMTHEKSVEELFELYALNHC